MGGPQKCNGSSQVGQRCAMNVLPGTTRCKHHQRQWCCSVRCCDNGVAERRRHGRTYYRAEVCWKHGQDVDSDDDCESDGGSFVETIKDIMNPRVESGDEVRRVCLTEVTPTTTPQLDDVTSESTHKWRTPKFALLRDAVKRCETTLVDFRQIVSLPSDAHSAC